MVTPKARPLGTSNGALNGSFYFFSILIGCFFTAVSVRAEPSIILTGPTSAVEFNEADDFFVDVMGDRLDFDNRRDFMWEELFDEDSINVDDGWSGTFQDQGGYVFPLFAGFPLALNTGNVGANFPIDTTKYTLVSYLDSVSERTVRALYWSNIVNFPDGTLKAITSDGYYTAQSRVLRPANLPTLVYHDLSSITDWTLNDVSALRLDSSTGALAGTTVNYQWFRLADPSSGEEISINWTTTNVPRPDASIVPRVNIYLDNDDNGYDGAYLATAPQSGDGFVRPEYDSGVFTLNTAILPPGDYFIYLELYDNANSDTLLARSQYSGRIRITSKPDIEILAPSITSGPDYADDILNNPWDMTSSTDIVNLSRPMAERNFQNASFQDGYFSAEAIIPEEVQGVQLESDSQIWLNTSPLTPIDTQKFRYLTYQMALSEEGYGNISDKVGNDGGWISRIVWWNEGISQDGSATKGNVIYEGIQSYSVDLAQDGALAVDDSYPAQSGWQGNATVSNFRLDTTEVNDPTFFYVYDVKLTAKPAPTSEDVYEVVVDLTDIDSESITLSIYSDENNEGQDGILRFGPAQVNQGLQRITLDTSGWDLEDTFIYAVAVDPEGNESVTYSTVPLTFEYRDDGGATVTPGVLEVWQPFFAVDPRETARIGDFNGDGKTDIITFTRDNPLAIGDVYVAISDGLQFDPTPEKWADFFSINSDEEIVIGDFNGDGIDDMATWLRTTSDQIYVALSTGSSIIEQPLPWLEDMGGVAARFVDPNSRETDPGDLMVAEDVDGDGDDDLILFARSDGDVYVALCTGSSFEAPRLWHDFFAVSVYERPLSADVDGDGLSDIITYATDSPTAFGDVYVAKSTSTQFSDKQLSSKWHDFFSIEQTQIIRLGDVNDDGKSDMFTFMPPPSGEIYNVLSQGDAMGENIRFVPDGVSTKTTDEPWVGDVNGDGRVDVIVFERDLGRVSVRITP